MSEKFIHIFEKEKKRPLTGFPKESEYLEIYEKLDIEKTLKEQIKEQIFSEKDFEIDVPILEILVNSFENRIDELLQHPDFNPFKEDLRKKFPIQYGEEPFEYKGVVYYLYHKGREFYIDSIIRNYVKRLLKMRDLIYLNEPLKYTFK